MLLSSPTYIFVLFFFFFLSEFYLIFIFFLFFYSSRLSHGYSFAYKYNRNDCSDNIMRLRQLSIWSYLWTHPIVKQLQI